MPLAGAICACMTIYRGARLIIQFTASIALMRRRGIVVGESALAGLFLLLITVYGLLALRAFGIFGSWTAIHPSMPQHR
jgi:hypothetical protein